jgi:hypothetical protein
VRTITLNICVALFVAAAATAPAMDFGVIINQELTLTDDDVSYSAMAMPWFASPVGEQADLNLSGGIGYEYANEKGYLRFELYRFELAWYPLADASFGFGRQNFQDSLGLIMTGLFDGVSASFYNIGGGRLDAGVFYTGLLYKKTASITMTLHDQSNYYDDDIYFASSRLATGVNWEKTTIFNSQGSISLSGIFQFDLNDTDSKLHSQYLAAKYSMPLGAAFSFECGAAFELLEATGNDPRAAFAVVTDVQWMLPGGLPDMLSWGVRFSTGNGDNVAAFTPLTDMEQGKVLLPNFSSIAMLQADYTARLPYNLFLEAFAACLFSTDEYSASPFLGAEFYAGLSWAPFSDLVVALGGGLFFPHTGDGNNADVKYRLKLTAGISL